MADGLTGGPGPQGEEGASESPGQRLATAVIGAVVVVAVMMIPPSLLIASAAEVLRHQLNPAESSTILITHKQGSDTQSVEALGLQVIAVTDLANIHAGAVDIDCRGAPGAVGSAALTTEAGPRSAFLCHPSAGVDDMPIATHGVAALVRTMAESTVLGSEAKAATNDAGEKLCKGRP